MRLSSLFIVVILVLVYGPLALAQNNTLERILPETPSIASETVEEDVSEEDADETTQDTEPQATEEFQGEKVFNASETFLDNGLQVIVIPNHRAPVITHMVWYKVGAAEEPRGKSGIAHFMEHLMFKGSRVMGERETLKPGEFSKIIRGLGGRDNAFTSQDYTAYFQSVASEHLERVMRMEAGRMRGMLPPQEEVESERLVILEERRQRTDNDPRERFREQLSANAYINHPYGTPVIGWYHEMEGLTWDDAKTFYDQWYAPNNAVLIVSGDVEPDDVFKLADDIYGRIPANDDLPERVRTISPALNSDTRVTLEHEALREPMLQTLYRVPSFRQDEKQALALQVLEEIMSGGPTSRLYKSLVVEQKIASSAGLSYRANAWDDARLWVYATPLPGQDIAALEDAIAQELDRVASEGVSDEELKDAVTRMQDAAIYARDSLTGPAMVIGQALSTGSDLDEVEYWPGRIEAVTAEDVQNAAQAFLATDTVLDHPPVTGVLLPMQDDETATEEVQE